MCTVKLIKARAEKIVYASPRSFIMNTTCRDYVLLIFGFLLVPAFEAAGKK